MPSSVFPVSGVCIYLRLEMQVILGRHNDQSSIFGKDVHLTEIRRANEKADMRPLTKYSEMTTPIILPG